MRRFLIPLLWSLAAGPAFAALPDAPRATYVDGEVLVKYRDHRDSQAARDLKRRLGLIEKAGLIDDRHESLELPAITDVRSMVELLRRDPVVQYAEPNYLRFKRAVATPNDPLFAKQWGLRNTGQQNFVPGGPAGVAGGDVNVLPLWDPAADGTFTGATFADADRVIVAIVDDGFKLTHPDLVANFLTGANCTRIGAACSGSPSARSGDDHGTLVAGCVGATGNNGTGVAGAAWNPKILPVRFDFSVEAEVKALAFARDHGALIVNGSFGGPEFSQSELDAITGTAGSLEAHDILFVVAAGNEDSNTDLAQLAYPANYEAPNLLAVAATNRQDEIASFSSYGPTRVHVAAAGLQIVTTTVSGGYSDDPDDVAGTSFASPYTAGVAALLDMTHHKATSNFYGYAELKARLIEGAQPGLGTDFGTDPDKRRTVGGRVDAANSNALSAQPSIVIKSYDYTAPLDPGTTPTVDLTLRNDWANATGTVTATLHASTDPALLDNGDVTITSGSVSGLSLAAGATDAASFDLSVAGGITQHKYVFFTLHLADGGSYATDRHFIGEIATLANSTTVTQAIGADIYDEFHTWHFNVPLGAGEVTWRTRHTANDVDIDLLVKQGESARYQIELGCSSNCLYCTSDTTASCQDPDVFVGGSASGDETVVVPDPAPGAWYSTVVNYGQPESDTPFNYQTSATVTGVQNIHFKNASFSVAKSAGTAAITISRSGTHGDLPVHFATSDGTALAGTNYTATSTTATIPEGSKTVDVMVPILDDPNQAGNLTVNLTLSSPGGIAVLGTPATAVLTITPKQVSSGGGGGGGAIAPAVSLLLSVAGLLRRRRAIPAA